MAHTLSIPAARAVKTKLSLEEVSKEFRQNGGGIAVLDRISLEIREGEFVCILGPSGCGKSTLLNIVGGFIPPTSGAVRIDGEPVKAPDPRRIFVFQERGVFPWLTVEGNIGFGLFRLARWERASRIAHYVKLVGLEGELESNNWNTEVEKDDLEKAVVSYEQWRQIIKESGLRFE